MASPFISRLEDEGIKVGVDVKICQMDLGEDIFEFIKQGKIMFALDQQQYLQGFLGVQFAYWHAKYGFFPPALVPTGPAVISQENLAQTEEGIKAGYR
jgi:simple sugar transport system substrate-binding protein